MEPISTTSIYYLMIYFIGYYIGTDLYNYCKYRQDIDEVKNNLNEIKSTLNNIRNKI